MIQADDKVFALMSELSGRGEEFCVATVVRTANATSAKAGAKAVVLADGAIEGFLGGSCVEGAVRRAAAEALAAGEPRLIRVKPGEEVVTPVDVDGVELHKSGCPSGGTVDLFIEPMRQAPRVIVCGASPVSVTLARLAQTMGYRITAVAAAEDLGCFDGIEQRCDDFSLNSLDVTARDFVVVATQGKRDREALTSALSTAADYIAFVGSRKKAATLLARIRENGLTEEQLSRLHAPAGLPINAIDPSEIALSIMAEVVASRRREARDVGTADASMDVQESVG
jgi:xanthine dehydrogenase accessory factor